LNGGIAPAIARERIRRKLATVWHTAAQIAQETKRVFLVPFGRAPVDNQLAGTVNAQIGEKLAALLVCPV